MNEMISNFISSFQAWLTGPSSGSATAVLNDKESKAIGNIFCSTIAPCPTTHHPPSCQAALFTGAAFSACQFASVWCYQQERTAPAAPFGSCLLDSLASRGGEGEAVQEVFHRAALLLGDQDAALGAGSSSVRSPAARTARLALEGVWGLALPLSDSQALAGGPGARQGIISALYGSGMHHVLSCYLGEQEGSMEEQEVRQECAWRLEQWEELSPDLARSSVPGCVLGALEAAGREDRGAVAWWREQGEDRVRQRLREGGVETVSTLHPTLTQLRQLGELGRLCALQEDPAALQLCVASLQRRDASRAGDFRWLEPVLSQRQVLAAGSARSRGLLEGLVLHSSSLARQAQGGHWVCAAQHRLGLAPSLALRWEEALVSWAQGQGDTAIALARRLLREVEAAAGGDRKAELLLPQILLRLGKWLHQQKTETSRTILSSFMTRSVTLLEQQGGGQGEQVVEAHLALAGFADLQYRQAREYLESTEFQERKESAQRNRKDVEVLTSSKADVNVKTARTIKENFAKLDELESDGWVREAEEYLVLSLHHYLAVLRAAPQGRRSQAAVYRLVALWFSNISSPAVISLLASGLAKVLCLSSCSY